MTQPTTGLKTYLKEIGRHRVLTKDEEHALFERLVGGDESARQEIIDCNLRLVVRLSLQFQNRGLPLEDLIQEGNIGLLEVIDRFDHTLGFRFSTYAAFWIRQSIQVAVRKQGSLIRLPVRKSRMLGHLSEIVHESMAVAGRAPTVTELTQKLNLSERQVVELLQISKSTVSLDAPIDEDGGVLRDRVADSVTPLPSAHSMRSEMSRKVRGVLEQLSEREHSILALRFGLSGEKARSLRMISRRVGLSQEGVRRVEQRALAKLGRAHLRRQLTGLI
jgi:RNA polymerase sigma factor (sigma-70 family)